MTGRHNLALALLQGSGPYGDKLNPIVIAKKNGASTGDSATGFLLDLFLQGDLAPDVRSTLQKTTGAPSDTGGGDATDTLRRFAHAVVTLPKFHLA